MTARRRQVGFTLLETIVALALLAVALLFTTALLLAEPRVVRRLDADRQAMRAMESTLEALRAQVIPLQDAEISDFNTRAGGDPPRDLKVVLTVARADADDLYRVTLVARYTVAGHAHEKRVDTLIWHP